MKITRCTLNVENVDIGIWWRQSSSLKIEYFCGNIYRLKTRMKTKGSNILKIFGLSFFENVNFKEDEELPLPEKLRLT